MGERADAGQPDPVRADDGVSGRPGTPADRSERSDQTPLRHARLAILISGRGSNMLAIDDACRDGRLLADVALVISNRPDAPGLESAARRGLRTRVIDHRDHADRQSFDAAIGRALDETHPDWIALAGFMRVLGPALVERWQGRILNIHPSLLPRHPGLDTHARALAAGDSEHGATVHIVTAELDAGPIVEQVRVGVEPGDDVTSLAARVSSREHALYVEALARCIGDDATNLTNRSTIPGNP